MALFRFSPGLDPASGLPALQRELERAFENPLGFFDFGPSGRGVFPAVNIFSDNGDYVIRIEVPGVAPEKLAIESQGRTLTISGERDVKTPEGGSFHRRERGVGRFSRSIQLPADLDLGRAQASFKHGMLTIRVPKKEEAKPRQIAVKVA